MVYSTRVLMTDHVGRVRLNCSVGNAYESRRLDCGRKCYVRSMALVRVKRAAQVLGISEDTLRRWAESGRCTIETDSAGRASISGEQLARLSQERSATSNSIDKPAALESVRNRFTGVVIDVVRDTVMAQVVVQAGPHRFVSLISREGCDELELEVGSIVLTAVKATNVAIELPGPQ